MMKLQSHLVLQKAIKEKDWTIVCNILFNLPTTLPENKQKASLIAAIEYTRTTADVLVQACDFSQSFEAAYINQAALLQTHAPQRLTAQLGTFSTELRIVESIASFFTHLSSTRAARNDLNEKGAVSALANSWRRHQQSLPVVRALIALTSAHTPNISLVLSKGGMMTALDVLAKSSLKKEKRALLEHVIRLIAMCAIDVPDNNCEQELLMPALLTILRRTCCVRKEKRHKLLPIVNETLAAIANVADCHVKKRHGYTIPKAEAVVIPVFKAWLAFPKNRQIAQTASWALVALSSANNRYRTFMKQKARSFAPLVNEWAPHFKTTAFLLEQTTPRATRKIPENPVVVGDASPLTPRAVRHVLSHGVFVAPSVSAATINPAPSSQISAPDQMNSIPVVIRPVQPPHGSLPGQGTAISATVKPVQGRPSGIGQCPAPTAVDMKSVSDTQLTPVFANATIDCNTANALADFHHEASSLLENRAVLAPVVQESQKQNQGAAESQHLESAMKEAAPILKRRRIETETPVERPKKFSRLRKSSKGKRKVTLEQKVYKQPSDDEVLQQMSAAPENGHAGVGEQLQYEQVKVKGERKADSPSGLIYFLPDIDCAGGSTRVYGGLPKHIDLTVDGPLEIFMEDTVAQAHEPMLTNEAARLPADLNCATGNFSRVHGGLSRGGWNLSNDGGMGVRSDTPNLDDEETRMSLLQNDLSNAVSDGDDALQVVNGVQKTALMTGAEVLPAKMRSPVPNDVSNDPADGFLYAQRYHSVPKSGVNGGGEMAQVEGRVWSLFCNSVMPIESELEMGNGLHSRRLLPHSEAMDLF